MAYVSASQATLDLFQSGAWWALANVYHGPQDQTSAYEYLQSHYNALGHYSPQALSAFVTRFAQAADAAASLRRRPVNPVDPALIPGSPLIPEQYQFQVVMQLIDVESGTMYTKLFLIDSQYNLSRAQVQAFAEQAAQQYVDMGGARYGPKKGRAAELSGHPGRITAVLQRSPQ